MTVYKRVGKKDFTISSRVNCLSVLGNDMDGGTVKYFKVLYTKTDEETNIGQKIIYLLDGERNEFHISFNNFGIYKKQ